MRPLTLAVNSTRPVLEEWRVRREIWRFRKTFWRLFPRWLLWGLLLLVMASVLFLAWRGSVWGAFAVLLAMSYLARCFEVTWDDDALEAHVQGLLARSRAAQESGNLNRSLQLARTAWRMAGDAAGHDEALEQQARLLLLQGHATVALRELSRTSSHHEPSPALRVRAHLLAGESSLALALARRMFARAQSPDTAQLIARALAQLQRPAESQQLSRLAGPREESAPAAPLPAPLPALALRPWEVHLPLGFLLPWMLATVMPLLIIAAMQFFPISRDWLVELYAAHGPFAAGLSGALQGGLMGLAQGWVLRRVFPEAGSWLWASVLGYGLGAEVLYLMTQHRALLTESSSLLTDAAHLGLMNMVAAGFQAPVLARWIRGSATWVLLVMGAALLAEFTTLGLVTWLWSPQWPPGWSPSAIALVELIVLSVLGVLIRGLVLGGVSGVVIHRDLARQRELYEFAPAPRPLTANPPHVSARTRPSAIEGEIDPERLPAQLPVARMNGPLFCPGADAFFRLTEEEFTQCAPGFSRYLTVIVPRWAESSPWPGEHPPQVGVLVGLYKWSHPREGEDYRMTVRMLARVRLRELILAEEGPMARIELLEEFPSAQPQAQLDRLRYRLNDYIRSTPTLELEEALTLRDPVFLADLIAANLELSLEERRALLEDLNPDSRIARVCEWLDRALLEPPRPPEGLKAYVEPIRFHHAWGE